ncbi:MAG: ABC transporter permease, partial [Geminicoccaceae bacterium]
ITTARAKGAPELRVVFRHALRNALLPIVTLLGLGFGNTLGGSVVTESIFNWPGLGRLMVDSILTRDLPITQAAIFVFAIMFIAVNLIVDVLYAWVDPRIRYD